MNSCLFADTCENQIHDVIASPNGRYKMVKFNRGCGFGGNSDAVHISIHKFRDKMSADAGNIFIAETGYAWDKSDTTVIAIWISNDHVEIRYDSVLKLFEDKQRYRNIRITYVPK